MDITEQGILVPSELDIGIYDRVNYLSDIRFFFYKNPVDVGATLCMVDMIDLATKKSFLLDSIYQHKVINENDVQVPMA